MTTVEITPDEFRAAAREAIAGSAEDAVSGGYGFDYDQPLDEAFDSFEAWETFISEGGPGDDIRPMARQIAPSGRWLDWMLRIWAEECRAEWHRLQDLWPTQEDEAA